MFPIFHFLQSDMVFWNCKSHFEKSYLTLMPFLLTFGFIGVWTEKFFPLLFVFKMSVKKILKPFASRPVNSITKTIRFFALDFFA